jgi:uncharacterized membrane protein YgdD (TMEM256/DUF423 family)
MKSISFASFFAFFAVILGALGAHALKETLANLDTTETWETAVLYHFVHSLALFAFGLWSSSRFSSSFFHKAITWSWSMGILFFSGSLYALALGGPKFLGPITPIGGLLFLVGWVLVFLLSLKTELKSS